MKIIKSLCLIGIVLSITGCGGEPSVNVIGQEAHAGTQPGASDGETIAAPDVEGREWIAIKARADLAVLRSNIWVSECIDYRQTTLTFDAKYMHTQTKVYQDRNCETLRENVSREVLEHYSLGDPFVEETGVMATRIRFSTVQSLRDELFYLENGQLYFGSRQNKSSYVANTLDFTQPYMAH